MRATIHNYLEAEKARREENGEKGFSLIELIIVVVILGILVAIAIPLFSSIQDQAELNALEAAAANGATAVASAIATEEDVDTAAASAGSGEITVTNIGSTTDVSGVCAQAEADGWNGSPVTAGPGCAGGS